MNSTFVGNEPGLERPLEHLRSILIPSETLEAWAIQRRVFALSHRRLLLAATSGRLILLTRNSWEVLTFPTSAGRTWRKLLCGWERWQRI